MPDTSHVAKERRPPAPRPARRQMRAGWRGAGALILAAVCLGAGGLILLTALIQPAPGAAPTTALPAPATAAASATIPASATPAIVRSPTDGAAGTLALGAGGPGGRCWAALPLSDTLALGFAPQLVGDGHSVWLFGTGGTADQPVAQLARWDGTQWSMVPAPPLGANQELARLGAAGPDDLWAIGTQRVATATVPLTAHWDGQQWTAVPAPAAGDYGNGLLALSAAGPGDVWAAGGYASQQTGGALLLHWDGHAWQATAPPAAGAGGQVLDVAAVAANDAWAVGARDQDLAFALHWDGRAWQPVPLPVGMGRPGALAAPAPGHVWLAGRTADHQPALLRWTGQAWQLLPRPRGGSSFLLALAAAGPDDLWTLAETEGQDVPTQVLHWTAAGWTDAPPPPVPAHAHLASMAVGPGGDVWVASAYTEDISGLTRNLVLRYQAGPCPAPTPTVASAAQPTRPFTLPGPLPTAVGPLVSAPGSADHYIFAFQPSSPNNRLVAYDYEQQTEIPVRELAGTGYEVSHIASDGQVVVWVQNHPPGLPAVEGYDLGTQSSFRVAQAPDGQTRFGGLAVAGGVVYYTVLGNLPGGAASGVYSHALSGGPDSLLGAASQDPVAGDGVLLWQEEAPILRPTLPPDAPPTATEDPNDQGARMALPGSADCLLHLRVLDGSVPDQVIARYTRLGEGGACFAGYAVSGDHIAWTTNDAGAGEVGLYTRSTGTAQRLASVQGLPGAPLIAGALVVWAGAAAADPGQSALLGYRIATGRFLRLVPQATAPIQPQFILDGRTVVYSLGPGFPAPGAPALYAVDVPRP